MAMDWFDKWFAKKSKFVWDESQKGGFGRSPSAADFEFYKARVQDLEKGMRDVANEYRASDILRRLKLLEEYLNIEIDDKPKYKQKEEVLNGN